MKSISSLSSLGSYSEDDFHADELNDHRHQPDSLPVRTSSMSENVAPRSDLDISPTHSLQYEHHRRGSCAISDHSVATSVNVEGILLNQQQQPSLDVDPRPRMGENTPSGKKTDSGITRKRSRRLTRSSVVSGGDGRIDNDPQETGSRASVDTDDQVDVCFPMNSSVGSIDYAELDKYAAEADDVDDQDYGYYHATAPTNGYQSGNRPLAPMGITTESSDDTKVGDYTPPPGPVTHKQSYVPPKQTVPNPYAVGEAYNSFADNNNAFVGEKDQYPPEPEVTWGHNRRILLNEDRFSFMKSESDVTIHARDLASLVDEGQSFSDLFSEQEGTWWLDCLAPTEKEMKVISKAFGIHPLTAEDIRTRETREKVELFRTYYFVCFHTFDNDPDSPEFLAPINVFMVVFKKGILSFHYEPIQHPANVRRRIRQLQDYVTVSSDWICYALLDDITDSFAPIIKEIEYETDSIEESVFSGAENFGVMLQRIGRARKRVMSMLRLLFGKADVIKMFAKRCNERWDNAPREEIGLYLGDIQDHIVTMYQNLSVYEKIFSRSHANYLAQLQVESVNSNEETTKMLGRMTVIGTILLPLNVITGLFGMNVRVPGQDGSNLGWFFGIIGVMIVFVISVSFVASKWMAMVERRNRQRRDEESATLLDAFDRTASAANSTRSNRSRANRPLSFISRR
uniref:ARAD1D40766p n=1 Tax=Blastobotrys adeninivorans TaxID=409370 RepID=A0A060THU4_BLAAD